MATVLDEGVFPIMSWAGPSGDMIRPDIMQDLAEAGFTISHSSPNKGERLRALDIAADAGLRVMLCDKAWGIGDDFKLTAARKRDMKKAVEEVRGHPALYGYYLRDEPSFGAFQPIAKAMEFMRELDPYHVHYVNHFPIRQTGWGAGSMEVFWRKFIEMCKPTLLSWDLYCIEVISGEQIEKEGADKPWVFAKDRIWVKPWYFENLEMVRTFGLDYGLPFWAFTMSVRHYAYPTPTEGHFRFQLMNDLAYGARGLQYFTYMGMLDRDGKPTETWQYAKKINNEIQGWASVLQKLTSTNVYHTGPIWSGTRAMRPDQLAFDSSHLSVACDGDPVTIGFFRDDRDVLFLLIVNKNPCDWARVTLHIRVHEDKVAPAKGKKRMGEIGPVEIMPGTGQPARPGPPGYLAQQPLVFSPGQARLLCVDDIENIRHRF